MKKENIKQLKDGLKLSIIKERFPWLLEADFENAIIGLDKKNRLVWYDGIWNNGAFEEGVWQDGTWKDGDFGIQDSMSYGENVPIWMKGTWEKGNFYAGYWKSGTWKDGNWYDGQWERGKWKRGKIWSFEVGQLDFSKLNPTDYLLMPLDDLDDKYYESKIEVNENKIYDEDEKHYWETKIEK